MDAKISAIEEAIELAMPEASIDYRNADGMHSFEAMLLGAEKTVGFEEDTFETQSAEGLVELLEKYHVFTTFRENEGPVFLLISGHGVTRLHPLG